MTKSRLRYNNTEKARFRSGWWLEEEQPPPSPGPCSTPGLSDDDEPAPPPTPARWELETVRDEAEVLIEQFGEVERGCDDLLRLFDKFTAELDAEAAECRRMTKRVARALREVATVRSSSALRRSGEHVTAVLRRRTGTDGTRDGDRLLVHWSDGSRSWEPYARVDREEDWDTLNALRTFESERAALTPARGLRPFGWDREVQKYRAYKKGARERRQRERRGLPIRDAPRRPQAPQAPPSAYQWQPPPATNHQPRPPAYGDWGGDDHGAWQPPPAHGGWGGGWGQPAPAHGQGYGGWGQRQHRTDYAYLSTLPLDELRLALQHVQDFTPEHFELLGRLDEDNAPKGATPQQMQRVKFFSASSPGGDCVICMSEMTDGEMALLPCGHAFHGDCVRQLTTSCKECPLCRKEI